jgi:hypothetical protein
MLRVLALLGQAAVYAAIAALVGYFADSPAYTWFPADKALIKLSLIHGGTRPECRKRTPEELAKLAPNMRRPLLCPRERLPLVVDVEIDGSTLYHAVLLPTGLFSDGPSLAYEKFAVAPGRHKLEVKLRDSARQDGYDYEKEAEIDLKPLQNFAVDFRAETGGFLFR